MTTMVKVMDADQQEHWVCLDDILAVTRSAFELADGPCRSTVYCSHDQIDVEHLSPEEVVRYLAEGAPRLTLAEGSDKEHEALRRTLGGTDGAPSEAGLRIVPEPRDKVIAELRRELEGALVERDRARHQRDELETQLEGALANEAAARKCATAANREAASLREVATQRKRENKQLGETCERYEKALHRIGFEPIGRAEATISEIYEEIVVMARQALDAPAYRHEGEGGDDGVPSRRRNHTDR